MITHLHCFGVLIGRAKTRKTLCGKVRPDSAMARGGAEATCNECKHIRDLEHQQNLAAIEVLNSKYPGPIKHTAPEVNYRNGELMTSLSWH